MADKNFRENIGAKRNFEGDEDGTLKRRKCTTDETLSDGKIEALQERCKALFDKLKILLAANQNLPKVKEWRTKLETIEEMFTFPEMVIAVVGKTGDGKSSLLNALMDHDSILPTSGMEACTAAVVEIVQNTDSRQYKAVVEFLEDHEWFDEVEVLLNELTGPNGKLRLKSPSDETLKASYDKIKAVYGKIDTYDNLQMETSVTQMLGQKLPLTSYRSDEFTKMVGKYVENTSGEQFWPIVKRVRIHIPDCYVCSSGTVLVDLPGVADSNAARDRIAQEYLRDCAAIWVVSNINRAVDDRTAKELLGESFKRQLLMDGNYGSVTFICTKTDILVADEIKRRCGLENKTHEHDEAVTDRKERRREIKEEISNVKQNISGLQQDLENDTRGDQESETAKEKQNHLKQFQNHLKDLEQKIKEIDVELDLHRKRICNICAKERNKYVRKRIKRDFISGRKEMMRNEDDDSEDFSDDEDEEEEAELEEEDNEGEEDGVDDLKVFCCSSLDYQKLKELRDGQPEVFEHRDGTEIPALQEYVHEVTRFRKKQGLEKLLRKLGEFVFGLNVFITEFDPKDSLNSQNDQLVQQEIEKLYDMLEPIADELSTTMQDRFNGIMKPKVEQGAVTANQEAYNISCNWGSQNRQAQQRSSIIPWQSYKAAVDREGVYTSRKYDKIDFNEDLARPMFKVFVRDWVNLFNFDEADSTSENMSDSLLDIFTSIEDKLFYKMIDFIGELETMLHNFGKDEKRVEHVSDHFLYSLDNKLQEMVVQLTELAKNKQREGWRTLPPYIKNSLKETYIKASRMHGKKMFERIKAEMKDGVDKMRKTMFDEAARKLMDSLLDLTNEAVKNTKRVCQSLKDDLRLAYEPFWNSSTLHVKSCQALLPDLEKICAEMRKIYALADVTNKEELPSQTSNRATVSDETGTELLYARSDNPGTSGYQKGDATFKVTRCQGKKCGLCTNLLEGPSFRFGDEEIFVNADMTCDVKNVLYVMTCNGCDGYYIGQTGIALRRRRNTHAYHIRESLSVRAPLSKHIDECCKTEPKFSIFPFYKMEDENKAARLRNESNFILKFKPKLNLALSEI